MNKIFIITAITLVLVSCSTTNQSSYFGYNNNPKIEVEKSITPETTVVDGPAYQAGNNAQDNGITTVNYYYVLPPAYIRPWDYPFYNNYLRFGSPYYYDYWDYISYYNYRDHYYFNQHHSHWNNYPYYDDYYYSPWYSDNSADVTPKRKDYRDFGVSRGEYGSPTRNVTGSSFGRGNVEAETKGAVKGKLNYPSSSPSRNADNSNYNSPKNSNYVPESRNTVKSPQPVINVPQRGENKESNIRQSPPRNENNGSDSRSGSSSSSSERNSSSSPSRSETKSNNSGQRSR